MIFINCQGSYKYGPNVFKASALPSGSSLSKCREVAIKALKVNDSCTHMKCTFGGVWNGGGGDGQKNLFVASFFFDRAAEVCIYYPLQSSCTILLLVGKSEIILFLGSLTCFWMKYTDISSRFAHTYICMWAK